MSSPFKKLFGNAANKNEGFLSKRFFYIFLTDTIIWHSAIFSTESI